MLVLKEDDPNLYDWVQEQNLMRQYDFLMSCIEIGLNQGPTAFDKYTLWSLNHVAVANISQFAGRFREEPIYVGDHIPPHYNSVAPLMDRFVSFLHENWYFLSATQLAAYGLWRLNWIHPFIEGNGRTARATCYYLLCVRTGMVLPGRKIVPERIRENRGPYVSALRACDRAWAEGQLDLSEMEGYLAEILKAQLKDQD
jgi:Fic family protein